MPVPQRSSRSRRFLNVRIVVQQLLYDIYLLGSELHVLQHVLVAVQVVQVAANEIVHAALQQVFGHELGAGAVVTTEGHEVELELITIDLEFLIVLKLHVHVALGMGYQGVETCVPHADQDLGEPNGGIHVGGLDQQVLPA